MTKYYHDGTSVSGTTYMRPILRPILRSSYSTKDYKRVAKCIRSARAQLGSQGDDKTANEITWELAKLFKQDNPKFEELKFVAACTESV